MVVKRALLLLVVVSALACASGASATSEGAFRPAGITASDSPVEAATALVEQRPALVDGADADELVPAGQARGAGGTTIVRFDQELRGVPVLGGEVVVTVDARRRVLAADGEVLNGETPTAFGPSVSAEQARQLAVAALAKGAGPGLRAGEPMLVIYDSEIIGGPGPFEPVLAWDLEVTGGDGEHWRVFVDATAGYIIQTMDLVRSAAVRYVCDAANVLAAVPCAPAHLARGEGDPATAVADVNSAYDFAGVTYDFYAGLGRDSIDGAGMPIVSTVRYCPQGYTCPSTFDPRPQSAYGFKNAYWDGTQMVYGAFFAAADDVVAHELTHGVTEHTSNLVYWYESGAINEAMSDIMGEFVDLANPGSGATADTPANRWLIGEDLPTGALRDMADSATFHDPDRIGSPYWSTGLFDNGGVHFNSGVANKAAVLIADGGTFNGQTITGIGLTKSAWLWYVTNTTLRFSSDYADLADTLEATCTVLVNLGTLGFTTADCLQVAKATLATEMRAEPADRPSVPAACAVGTPRSAWSDGFAGGSTAGWTIGRTIGSHDLWFGSSAASPDGTLMTWPTASSENVRGVDASARSDSTMAMATGVLVPSRAYLRLEHWFAFEMSENSSAVFQGYDAGVIEYSVEGGAWTDIGSLTAVNGYTGTINADGSSDNPLEGRSGFVGASNGALVTQVDLAPLAGRTVRFRFRIGTDSGGGQAGWYIDEVGIHTCTAAASSGLSPTSGTVDGGTTLTISGSGLAATTGVTIGGVTATSVTVVDDAQVLVVTPAGAAGAVPVVITTANGSVTVGMFSYVAAGSGAASLAVMPSGDDRTRGVTGAWTVRAATDRIRVTFAYAPGTTYAIKAVRGSTIRRGACTRTGSSIVCSVKAPTGRWRIVVTPKINGKTSTAISRVVRT